MIVYIIASVYCIHSIYASVYKIVCTYIASSSVRALYCGLSLHRWKPERLRAMWGEELSCEEDVFHVFECYITGGKNRNGVKVCGWVCVCGCVCVCVVKNVCIGKNEHTHTHTQ